MPARDAGPRPLLARVTKKKKRPSDTALDRLFKPIGSLCRSSFGGSLSGSLFSSGSLLSSGSLFRGSSLGSLGLSAALGAGDSESSERNGQNGVANHHDQVLPT